MRILLVGAGGVGDAIVKIAANRNFYEQIVVADYDLSRAEKSVAGSQRIAIRLWLQNLSATVWMRLTLQMLQS